MYVLKTYSPINPCELSLILFKKRLPLKSKSIICFIQIIFLFISLKVKEHWLEFICIHVKLPLQSRA